MMNTSKIFLPTEYATALELIEYPNDVEKFSYEYLSVSLLVNSNILINQDLMRQAYRFLVMRHPNMNAYYVKNMDGSLERKYAPYDGKDYVYFDYLDEGTDQEVKSYIRSKRSLEAFKTLPLQKYYFLKTKDHYYLICYSHHAFKDVYIEKILMEELIEIYHVLERNKTASYEEATKDLKKINDYSVVLENFMKDNEENLHNLVEFLKPKLLNVDISEESLISKNSVLCKAEKMRVMFKQSEEAKQIMKLKNIKENQCILTLSQIALQKLFQIKGTLPFWKLNGSRPEWAQGVLCSFIKDQVFINPLNESSTFFQQYQDNYSHLKESLTKFNNCDYSSAIKILSGLLGKDCSPKVCFNYYIANQTWKHTYFSKILTDEYDVVNSNFNMYIDFGYDYLFKVYWMTIFYKKEIFDHSIIKKLMDFILIGYKHVDKLWNLKIENITLDFVQNLKSLVPDELPRKAKF